MKNDMVFVSRYKFRSLPATGVGITEYDLFEDETHRFAFLTFLNVSIQVVNGFAIRFTFFDENHNMLSKTEFAFRPNGFASGMTYSPKSPLVMPKDAAGFIYECFDVEKETFDQASVSKKATFQTQTVNRHTVIKTKPLVTKKSKLLGLSLAVTSVAFLIPTIYLPLARSGYIKELTEDIGEVDFEYEMNDGNIIITGPKNTDYYANLSIQPTYNGHPVTEIRPGAFMGTTIANLSINGEEDVLDIGDNAFSGCGIKNLDVYRVRRVGVKAFSQNMFSNLFIGEVRKISDDAFTACKELQKANLKDVDYISGTIFNDCYNLKTIYLDYCGNAKDACREFPKQAEVYIDGYRYEIDSGIQQGNDVEINGVNYSFDSSSYRYTVTGPGFGFYGGQNVTIMEEIKSGNGDIYPVSRINDSAFMNHNINSLTLNGSDIDIGRMAFYQCKISNIYAENCSIGTIDEKAFAGNAMMDLNFKSVSTIHGYAFNHCLSLSSCTLNSVDYIAPFAFFACDNLTLAYVNSEFNDKSMVIGDKAFPDMTKVYFNGYAY